VQTQLSGVIHPTVPFFQIANTSPASKIFFDSLRFFALLFFKKKIYCYAIDVDGNPI